MCAGTPSTRSSWMAVSAVISLVPRTISLMACAGRPIRRASSAWLRPTVSMVSASSSPGGTGRSENTCLSVAIMCADLLNADDGHRVAPECHDHPPAVNQRDRVLALAVPLERVKAQRRNLVQVVDGFRRLQYVDPLDVPPRDFVSPLAGSGCRLHVALSKPLRPELDLHPELTRPAPIIFTSRVNAINSKADCQAPQWDHNSALSPRLPRGRAIRLAGESSYLGWRAVRAELWWEARRRDVEWSQA